MGEIRAEPHREDKTKTGGGLVGFSSFRPVWVTLKALSKLETFFSYFIIIHKR